MNKQTFLLPVIFFSCIATGFSQDTSSILNKRAEVLQSMGSDSSSASLKDLDKPHAEVNTNVGTAVPSTTSGTMNSQTNPNTQFVIPFGKGKKKANAESSGTTTNDTK